MNPHHEPDSGDGFRRLDLESSRSERYSSRMSVPTLSNVVDGRAVPSRADAGIDLIDPATEEVYARAPISTPEEIDRKSVV